MGAGLARDDLVSHGTYRGQARSHRGVVLLDFDRIKNAIHLYKILFLKNFKPGGLVKIDEFKIIFAFKQNHATTN